jgi:hypothetical protein
MKGCRPAQGGNHTRGAEQHQKKPQRRRSPSYAELAAQSKMNQADKPTRNHTGHEAAMAEYHIYKAAGMLREWRARWKAFLIPRR